MNMAILFWFYKELDVCKNRLTLIKKYNPGVKIYGLYGGNIDDSAQYEEELSEYLEDFYTYAKNSDEHWKWLHGDLMILDWYDARGRHLEWDSIAIVQWDALTFDSIKNLVPGISKDQIFFSGYRTLPDWLEKEWHWTTPNKEERQDYLAFMKYCQEKYNYSGPTYCCLFIFAIFPKIFFEKYLTVENKELGFLEYKLPVLANIFDISVYEYDLGVQWHDEEENMPLNAIPEEITKEYIETELRKKDGHKMFHPYFKIYE